MGVEMRLFRNTDEAESFAAGQTIFKQGEPGHSMYVVLEGEVEIVYLDKVIETVGPNGIIGEMALIDNSPRTASAVARTDCRVMPINQKRFHFMVQETPNFASTVMRVMADRLRRSTRLGYPLMQSSSEEDIAG